MASLNDWILQATPIAPPSEDGWAISGWASLGGFVFIAALLVGGAIKYGPPMIKWLKARYLPPFSVEVLEEVLRLNDGDKLAPQFRAHIPRGDYRIRCSVQIGEWVGKYESAATPNTYTQRREMFVREGIIPPAFPTPPGTRAMVLVEIQRVNGMFVRSVVRSVKSTYLR